MLRSMEEGINEAATALEESASSCSLVLDTVIMDEAACVLETAIPVVLALGVKNLVLVGVRGHTPFVQPAASSHSIDSPAAI